MTEPLQHRHSPTDPPLAKRLWDFEPGSRVVIEPGTYVGGMVLPHDVTLVAEKGLGTVTLESSRGPLLSVEGAGRVHLEGLILRGSAIGLGAVLVIDSEAEVEVRGCLLSGGRGEGVGGGGVAIRVGKLVMARCRLVDNTALQGGALSACGPALVEVSNSVFARNSAEGLGGGAVFANEGATGCGL